MTKIFITGATSSIGMHLVQLLLTEEVTLHLLVRSKKKCVRFQHPRIVLFEGDLHAIETINQAMKGCDQVYHLAANASVWLKKSGDYFNVNVEGTRNVLDVACSNKIKKVVVTSSAGVYGPSISSPIYEQKAREIDFFNEYESSKALAELLVHRYVVEKGLNAVIVSPTRVYGPILYGPVTSTTLLIDKYVNGSWRIYPGTGNEIGNYAYIEDVAFGHILAMNNGKKGHHYILGGENCNYVDFYKSLSDVSTIHRTMFRVPNWIQLSVAWFQLTRAKILGVPPAITPKWLAKGKYNWEVNCSKAQNELGYSITPLEIGLSKTVKSLQK